MPNGTPGDHPLTDILAHGLPVFSPEIDELVREIAALGGFESKLANLWLLDIGGEVSSYRQTGQESKEAALLLNVKFILEAERNRLQSRGGSSN